MVRKDWCKLLGWSEEHLEELRNAGYAYVRQGKYDIAMPFFEALNVLDRDSAYDAQTLGAILLELNQPSKAVRYLDKALKLDADHTPTLLNLTKAFFMLGKVEEAVRLCKILKNDPNPGVSNLAEALLLAYT